MMAVVRRLFQSMESSSQLSILSFNRDCHLNLSSPTGFLVCSRKTIKFASASSHTFDHIRRSLGQKLFVAQLALVVGCFFFYFSNSFFRRSRSAATSIFFS